MTVSRPLRERWLEKIDRTATCWLWTGYIDRHGYGSIKRDRTDPKHPGTMLAHRAGWELLRGPIPNGLTLDHLCRVRHCVNPDHMEPVTMRINGLRGIGPTAIHARQTHCVNGHEFTLENTYVWNGPRGRGRTCRGCNRAIQRRRKQERISAVLRRLP